MRKVEDGGRRITRGGVGIDSNERPLSPSPCPPATPSSRWAATWAARLFVADLALLQRLRTTTNIVIGKRNLKVVRQLAEGGFSFVYLVEGSGEKFALKKVLSQLPEQAVAAKWEIEVHTAIKPRQLHTLIDHCVVPAANGAEEFRLLMPLYPNGTLLDKALQLMERNERMPERQALLIFQQILLWCCRLPTSTTRHGLTEISSRRMYYLGRMTCRY